MNSGSWINLKYMSRITLMKQLLASSLQVGKKLINHYGIQCLILV